MSKRSNVLVDGVLQAVRVAADPRHAVRRFFSTIAAPGPTRVLAVGKAAHAMAEAAAPSLGDNFRAGLIIAPPSASLNAAASGFEVREADHPLPTERNVLAAAEATELVKGLRSDEALLVLLSGGASALLTLPVPGLSLNDLRAAARVLMHAGATVDELNCVRRHCEQLKGGGLLRLATTADCKGVLSLILSDVVGDRLESIGSGPTAPDPTTYADALAVVERHGLTQQLVTVAEHLRRGAAGKLPETLKPGDDACGIVANLIVGRNDIATAAAAQALGQWCTIIEQRGGVVSEARSVATQLASKVIEAARANSHAPGPRAFVWGGETTVTVKGNGRGGRNQELALAAAIALDGVPGCMVMSFATDGVDGNSPAAGAVVTGDTLADARAAGLDAVGPNGAPDT